MLIKVPFCVAGTDYVIQTEEAPDYIKGLASTVDRKIAVYLRMGSMVTLTMSAVLSAMECCDESAKLKADVENLRKQIAEYISEASRLTDEKDELIRKVAMADRSTQLNEMERENKQLREQIGKLVEQISHEATVTPDNELIEENQRLCEELEKANAFIEEASRAINERDELQARLDQAESELAKLQRDYEILENEFMEK